MPTPSEGEKQSDFIGRCVRQVMGEGKEQQAALGECYGIWRQHHGGTAKLFCEMVKQQPGVGSVHAQTALGNQSARRRKQRQLAIEQAEQRRKKPVNGSAAADGAANGDLGKDWSLTLKIAKAEPERQMIFGWASVVAKDGKYIIDKQGDIIPVEELENAVLEYMLYAREHGVMHAVKGTGRLVMSFLTTPEFMKAFKLKQADDQIGWIVGYKIEDPELWAAHKRGILPEFSIGGSSVPFESVDDDSPLNLDVEKVRGDRRIKRAPFRSY
jgi:hypothetical protein